MPVFEVSNSNTISIRKNLICFKNFPIISILVQRLVELHLRKNIGRINGKKLNPPRVPLSNVYNKIIQIDSRVVARLFLRRKVNYSLYRVWKITRFIWTLCSMQFVFILFSIHCQYIDLKNGSDPFCLHPLVLSWQSSVDISTATRIIEL